MQSSKSELLLLIPWTLSFAGIFIDNLVKLLKQAFMDL